MAFRFTIEHLEFFSSGASALVFEVLREQTEKYGDSLRIQTSLRSLFPTLPLSDLRAAVELTGLRAAAGEKCGLPPDCLCTRDTLEMASSLPAALLHASLLPQNGRIIDCCSGIGADAIRFGKIGEVFCIEADPVISRMCRHNLVLSESSGAVFTGTAEHWLGAFRAGAADAVFADPARRDDVRRVHDAEHGSPPLSFFSDAARGLPLLIKTAPASVINDAAWGRAWVAVGRECKEQLAHRGLDLPARCVIHAASGYRWTPSDSDIPESDDPGWIIEPHNAVILSGAVAEYMHEHGAVPVDARIAYGFAGKRPPTSPLHQTFRILRLEAFHRKKLRQAVRDLDFGPGTEIKKRGFPQTPEQLRAELPLTGERDGVVIIARRGNGHLMILAERERRESAIPE